jgi:inorganic pyrophosphatase
MSTQHPWHQVSPGSNIPENVNAIIEIPKGSKAKYEIDKDLISNVPGQLWLYPANLL